MEETRAAERSTATRRTHTKSRGGCLECKRRKIKVSGCNGLDGGRVNGKLTSD